MKECMKNLVESLGMLFGLGSGFGMQIIISEYEVC